MRRDKRKGEKEGKGERKKRRGEKKECKRKQRRRGGKRKGGEKKKEREKRKIMRRKKVVMRDLNPHPSRVYSHYPQEDSQMCLCGISLQQDRIGHEGKPYSVTVAVSNEAITHVHMHASNIQHVFKYHSVVYSYIPHCGQLNITTSTLSTITVPSLFQC